MAISPPFVNFKNELSEKISNSKNIILDNTDYVSIVDSIKYYNLTDNEIVIYTYISRDNKDYEYDSVSVKAFQRIDILNDETLTLLANDRLIASSDYSSNLFNSFVTYRQLIETGENDD